MKKIRHLAASALLISSSLLQAADTEKYIEEARVYLEQGEAKAAVIQLKNALQENPASIEARLMLGRIYLQTGDGASAEKEFERARKLNAAAGHWQHDLGRAWLMQGKFNQILDNLAEDPAGTADQRLAILLLRGDAHLGLRQFEQARSAYRNAGNLNGESQEAMLGLIMTDLAENRRDEAMNSLDNLLSRYPENVTARVIRGEIHMRNGEVELASLDFNKALELQPEHVQALLGRANIRLSSGQLELARADIETLQNRVPGHPRLLHLGGALALLEKDLDRAETLLQQAYNANPGNLQTQTMLGAVNYFKGNYEAAYEHLSQVLRVQPDLLQVIKLLASVQYRLKQPDEVVKLLEPALQHHPDDAQLMAMLGTAYMQVKRFEEGSALMSHAIEINPNLAEYRTQLALGLFAQGKTGDAIQQLESSIDLGQDLVQAEVLLVLSHLNKKDFDKALAVSQALEQKSPDNPVGYNLSGLTYLLSGDREQARQRFRKTLQIDPGFITAEVNLARMAVQEGNLEQARNHYQDALKKAPRNTAVLLGLADLARRNGDREKMHQLLEQAHNGEPASSQPGLIAAQAYLAEKAPLKALRMTSQLVASFPNQPAVLSMHGKTQLAAGDPVNAITTFTRLLDRVRSAETLQLLGNAQQAAGRLDDARESYRQALEITPEFVPGLLGQYSLELDTGDYDKAVSLARSIQQALPDNPAGYEFEGTAQAMKGASGEAIKLYQKAYRMQPSEKLSVLLSRQYARAGDPQRGVELLREWLNKEPESLEPRIVLSMLLLNQGRNEEAIREYEQVIERDENNAVALNNLAWLYSGKDDRRALALGKRAYQLASTQPAIIDTYGWILVKAGEIGQATGILKQAAELAPKNQEIIYHLGYALHKAGKREEARNVLQKVVELNQGSELAESARKLLAENN